MSRALEAIGAFVVLAALALALVGAATLGMVVRQLREWREDDLSDEAGA